MVGGAGCDIPGFTSRHIQWAVDAVSRAGGGVVRLDAGVFDIIGPVRLSSGITLEGAGDDTVLRKTDGIRTRLVVDADYGEFRAEVEDASGFSPGMSIQVYDESQKWGWAESTAIVTAVEDNVIFFDRHLERDYQWDDGGTVTNAGSVIECADAAGVRIRRLSIDGNGDANYPIGGCRAGGIYLFRVRDCSLEQVKVKGFNGDGISWQITEDVSLKGCVVSDNAESGMHPGTGSVRTAIEDCVCSGNGHAGIFICWRVRSGTFRGNSFSGNGRYGISIGHKDSDNAFTGNEIRGNGVCGIYFRREKEGQGADRNVWSGNVVEDNGEPEGGCGVCAEAGSKDNVFRGNVVRDAGSGRQKDGFRLDDGVTGFVIEPAST